MRHRYLSKVLVMLTASILFSGVFLSAKAFAAAEVFSSGINLQGSTIDLGQGGSKIADTQGDLHLFTDNLMYLNAPTAVITQNSLFVGYDLALLRQGEGRDVGSKIYENGQLHVATDDNLYLDAPTMTYVQGGLTVSGDVSLPSGSVSSAMIADGTVSNADLSSSAAIAYSKLNLSGSVVSADIAADTILAADIATSAVGTAEILDGTIANADLAAGTFTNITGVGTIAAGTWNGTDIAVADGGTGASSAADARTNLGLAIGTNVQAYDADLTTYAGITPSANIQSLLGSADYSTARTNLGVAIGTDVQAYNATLATVAGGTYAGDDSIVTVGTVATGTWNAGAVTSSGDVTVNGGDVFVTGKATCDDAAGTAGQVCFDSVDNNLYVYDGSGWRDMTAGAAGAATLDDGYNASSGASTVIVDAGDLTFRSNAGVLGDIVVDLNSTGDFILQDAGTDVITFSDSGNLTVASGTVALNNDAVTSDGDLAITGATGFNATATLGDLDVTATAGSIILTAGESANDSIQITSSVGGIDISASGAADGEDIDITATGSSVNITSTQAAADAIVLNASTAVGGIDITSNADIDITTTGAADEDISITNTGGSVNITATEAATDAIVISASTALGGIDITSNEDIDITTTGATGEDISVTNTGGSVIITATEAAADAIVLNASTAVGGIDITSNADIDITTTGAADEDISITNTGGSIALSATEDAADAITITTTAGGIDITAGGDTAGDDLDIVATGATTEIRVATASTTADAFRLNASAGGIDIDADDGIAIDAVGASGEDIVVTNTGGSISLVATEAAADAIVLNASTALGGIDITSNNDIDITTTGAADEDISITNTGGSVNITATEADAAAIVLNASVALGGIDITSNADIDITTTGTSGEDITISNSGGSVNITSTEDIADSIVLETATGGVDITATNGGAGDDIDITASASSVNITAAEAVADAIVINASTALGGIDITSNADIDITTTGAADEDISITNTGGSIILSATESANDSIQITSTAGGIDISASGAADGEDIDITATGSSVNIDSTQDAADAITIQTSAGGIDITAGGDTAGDDLDIVTTGAATEMRLGSASAEDDALVIAATADTGGVHITAGDGEVAAIGTDESIELRATADTIVALTAGGSLVVDGATTVNTGTDGAIDLDYATATNGAEAMNVKVTSTAAADNDVVAGMVIDLDDDGATATSALYGISIAASDVTGNAGIAGIYLDSTLEQAIVIETGTETWFGTPTDIGGNGLASIAYVEATAALEIDGAVVSIGDTEDGATATGDGDLLVQDALEVDGAVDLDGSVDFDGTTFDVDGSGLVSLTSTTDANQAILISTTAGGMDVTVTGDTAGDDLDITTVGAATEMRLGSASAEDDALVIAATADTGGVHITAGDGEVAAIGTDESIELRATADTIVALTAGGSLVVDAATTASTNTDGAVDINHGSTASSQAINVASEVVDDNGADTQAGVSITMTNSADDSDIVYGMTVAELGGAASGGAEYAIYQAGTAWDYGLYVEDAALIAGSSALNGGITVDTDNFTVSGTNGNTAILSSSTTGNVLDIGYDTVTQTGAMAGVDVDFSAVTTDATNALYGVHVNDQVGGTASTEYGIYVEGTNWDYGLYVADDAHFNTKVNLGKQAVSTAAAAPGSESVTVTASFMAVTVGDDTDVIQLAETNAADGDLLFILNVDGTATDTVGVDAIANQVDLVAGADVDLDQSDSITLMYSSDLSAWVQVAASNNTPL